MVTSEAQEYIEKNYSDKSIKEITFNSKEEKLIEDLIIQDYPNLEQISLPNHELTSLTIANCPNLKEINVRNNQLTKLEIGENNQINELIAGHNEINPLNLTNCPNFKKLMFLDILFSPKL